MCSPSWAIRQRESDTEDHELRGFQRRDTDQSDEPAVRDVVLRHRRGIAADEIGVLRCCPLKRAGTPRRVQERRDLEPNLRPDGFAVRLEHDPGEALFDTAFEEKQEAPDVDVFPLAVAVGPNVPRAPKHNTAAGDFPDRVDAGAPAAFPHRAWLTVCARAATPIATACLSGRRRPHAARLIDACIDARRQPRSAASPSLSWVLPTHGMIDRHVPASRDRLGPSHGGVMPLACDPIRNIGDVEDALRFRKRSRRLRDPRRIFLRQIRGIRHDQQANALLRRGQARAILSWLWRCRSTHRLGRACRLRPRAR